MNNKERMESALTEAAELRSKYNALAEKGETEGLEELRTQREAKLAEARRFAEDADADEKESELRSKVASLYIPSTKSVEKADSNLSDEIRSVIDGSAKFIEVRASNAVANFNEYRAAPIVSGGKNYTNDEFVTAVMTSFKENNCVFRAGARILPTNTGEELAAPLTATYGNARVAENGAFAETAENSVKVLRAHKYGSIALVSRELVEDTGVDIAGLVAGMVGDDLTGVVNKDFLIGDGASKPQGIFNGAGTVTAAGIGMNEAEVYRLYYSVKDSARSAGAWFMHPDTAANIRSLDSGLWAINPGSDNPDLLLGRPVFTDSNIAIAGANAKSIVFGNPKAYMVRSVRGLRVERSDDYKFGNDLVAVKVVWRGDGVVTDTNALKVLTHPAA